MYLSVGVVFAIVLVLLSPVIWIAWWLLADLGSRAGGPYAPARGESTERSHRRAA
jgi:hypothetical protein